MNATIHDVLAQSQAGNMIFPEVVRRLMEAGVESYFVDAVQGEETVYLGRGGVQVEKMTIPMAPVAEEFTQEAVLAAIRAAQADEVRYPEFMQRAAAAGVAGYWAFLTGRKVIYFGRKGEFHVEHFPGAPQ